ncbi:MAG: hypothetical protein WB791_02925 [Waddliaceae bacterium]
MHKVEPIKKFTQKQLHAIPFIVSSSTYAEAAEKANVSRQKLCEWMHNKDFKAEVRRLQDQMLDDAVSSLKSAASRAVDVLVSLLGSEDQRVQRGAANDILNLVSKFKELQDIEGRLIELERNAESSF